MAQLGFAISGAPEEWNDPVGVAAEGLQAPEHFDSFINLAQHGIAVLIARLVKGWVRGRVSIRCHPPMLSYVT